MVQGGRVTVADTTMPFVRIGMAGIPVGELAPATQPEQHWMGAVLNLDQAEELAAGLRTMMAHEPWGVAALATPARANPAKCDPAFPEPDRRGSRRGRDRAP